MFDHKPQSLHSWVRQWENAGEQLAGALSDYAGFSQATNPSKSQSTSNVKDLVSRMNDMLEDLPFLAENHIAQSRWALARTQNRFTATFSSIPQEILADIFTLVADDRSNHFKHQARDISTKADVQAYYRRLYSLLAVCSAWRNVALSHGALWSLVPISTHGLGWPGQHVTELSLERARGHRLSLAAHFKTDVSSDLVRMLQDHYDRFRTINVIADSHRLMQKALSPLFNLPHSSLTELSLRRIPNNRLPEPDFPSFTEQTNPGHIGFLKHTFESLVVLRLQNVHIDWELFILPKLAELRVEAIEFPSVSKFKGFILALSTATGLQKPEISNIEINPHSEEVFLGTMTPHSVTFKALQQLYIGNLFVNTTRLLLQSIAPGPYTLSLNLSRGSIFFDWDCVEDEPAFESLLESLQGVKVDTLLIDGDDCFDTWITPDDLHRLLQRLPSVTTLKINCWSFVEGYWKALTVPRQSDPAKATSFPKLRSVQITASLLLPLGSEATINNFIASHPLQQFTLGATRISAEDLLSDIVRADLCKPITNCEQSAIARHLKSKIPDFQLVDFNYVPEEFLPCNKSWGL